MIRISKNTPKVLSIKYLTDEVVDSSYEDPQLDSFLIIPGVTQFEIIYSKGRFIFFKLIKGTIGVEFQSEADLERYFLQLMREIKINQITNLSVDVDKKNN